MVLVVKNQSASAGDIRDWVGKISWGGHGDSLQYSCLEKPTDSPGKLQSIGSHRVGHNLRLSTQKQ